MSISTIPTVQLNVAQEAVVNSSEKRILALAGPGAGKTFVLKEWIKQKLQDDPRKSYNILGLTFTNNAAREMNNRLAEDIIERSKQVNLMTFHSFCARVVRQYGYYIEIPANFEICNDEDELIEILKKSVQKSNIEAYHTYQKYFKNIRLYKHRVHTPYKGIISEEHLKLIYNAYEKELRNNNYLDFDDLLLKTHQLLKTYPVLKKHYQKIYPYICIDELQDTNQLQYEILRFLIGDNTTLLAVGDDNQVIYEWNGADYQRLQSFKEQYNPRVIHLPLNYRCPPCIIEVSNKLIAKNYLRLGDFIPNQACNISEGEVSLKPFDTFEKEVAGIAYDIAEKHEPDFGQVTILARRKKLLDKMSEALQKQNIPHRVHIRKGEFISAPLAWLHEILHLFNSPNRERSLKIVVGAFNQMANLDISVTTIKNKKQQDDNATLLSAWLDETNQKLKQVDSPFYKLTNLVETQLGIKTYKSFYTKIFKWFNDYEKQHEEEVLKESIYNYEEYNEEKQVWHSLAKEIFERLGDEIPLSTFLQELSLTTKETPLKNNEANLMTIHAAKGQGFDHVYLIGMVNDELPSYHALKSNKQKAMEEERRNCYVAITRAAQKLTLSYASQYFGWQKEPSQFLKDMELL